MYITCDMYIRSPISHVICEKSPISHVICTLGLEPRFACDIGLFWTYISLGSLYVYKLFSGCVGLFWVHVRLVSVYIRFRTSICMRYRALLPVYMALWRVYRALVSIHMQLFWLYAWLVPTSVYTWDSLFLDCLCAFLGWVNRGRKRWTFSTIHRTLFLHTGLFQLCIGLFRTAICTWYRALRSCIKILTVSGAHPTYTALCWGTLGSFKLGLF